MITYLPGGRRGNAYFQAAATIALALRNGTEFSMPVRTSSDVWSPLVFHHLINPNYDPNRIDIVIKERQFHYVPIDYNKEWNSLNVRLEGYFQSEKYFIDFKDEVIRLFNVPYQFNEGFVSVHLRRTDFVELSHKHPPVSDQWYFEAMSNFKGKKFLILSDDIEYCKRTFGHRNDCYFSEGKTAEEDMIQMSNCEHNICSASTFAWWGMYLNMNPDKKVIFPNNGWFTENWDGADVSDVLPEWVTKL